LFIDEIQNNGKALSMLRYFYEEAPHIHVIVAGSLLESLLNQHKISFPVGRVEYFPLRPCSFSEFLDGIGESFDKNLLENIDADPVHDRVMQLFRDYALVGGMPEAVSQYGKKRDVLSVSKIYDSLIAAYIDDAEKYASNDTETNIIRHCLKAGWKKAAETITFEGFAGSQFKSRDVGNALRTLQKAFLLELVYPVVSTEMPAIQNYRKRPKLFWLDTGLVNYFSQIQSEVFFIKELSELWRGRIAEHIAGQELISSNDSVLAERIYWRRDAQGSDAEIDFVIPYRSLLIPVEVKSGYASKMKSLHLYMNAATHNFAVRVWQSKMSVDDIKTPDGKNFRLLNIPFYYISALNSLIGRYI
jgi:predicted AAA+ superfamily ATPase